MLTHRAARSASSLPASHLSSAICLDCRLSSRIAPLGARFYRTRASSPRESPDLIPRRHEGVKGPSRITRPKESESFESKFESRRDDRPQGRGTFGKSDRKPARFESRGKFPKSRDGGRSAKDQSWGGGSPPKSETRFQSGEDIFGGKNPTSSLRSKGSLSSRSKENWSSRSRDSSSLRLDSGSSLRPREGSLRPTNISATDAMTPRKPKVGKSKVKEPKLDLTGNPTKDTLAPLDTIIFGLPKKKQPQVSRQSLALANKFFQTNYRFLFASSSIQNQPPNPHVPEIVVLGASNAGKSSLLNGLFGRTDAARVSSKAGHTITLNGHGIGRPQMNSVMEKGSMPPGHGLVMMDTPGYGFKSRKTWGDEIHRYIQKRAMLKGAIILIPAAKDISNMDKWVLELLASSNKRTLIILTKADRGGKDWKKNCSIRAEQIRKICQEMSDKLQSGWTEGDGWVPTIYATAAGWDNRLSVGAAPGLAGARRAILEELAGLQLGQSKVEAAPEVKTYGGEMVSWDSLGEGAVEGEEGDVVTESDVLKESDIVEENMTKKEVKATGGRKRSRRSVISTLRRL